MLPSVPLNVTWVAFVAVTVTLDVLPGAIESGLAVIVIAGAEAGITVIDTAADALPPAPMATAV